MIEFPGLAALWDVLPEARVVGGAVRDQLAGRRIADVDLASPLTPEALGLRLNAAGIRCIATGTAHGTMTAVLAGQHFEITTLRRDVKTDGRHAKVIFTDDWHEDAARRDFTINAMSTDRDGTLHDYFGGVADLSAGIVRFVGDARTRISEDYLRIMRFFRFFARYAVQPPDQDALAAIEELRDGVLRLSAERVWSELKRILAAENPIEALRFMQSTGVMDRLLPEGFDIERLAALVRRGAPAKVLLRAAALLAGDMNVVASHLKVSREEADILQSLKMPDALGPRPTDDDLRRALADTDAATLIARTWLSGNQDIIRARLAKMARPIFPLQGRDLLELGIPPGPRVGEILHDVRQWWLANGCMAGPEACRGQARLRVSQLGT